MTINKYNTVSGISRWTNASRYGASHYDDGTGKPICGGNKRKVFSWSRDIFYVTCDKCIKIANLI